MWGSYFSSHTVAKNGLNNQCSSSPWQWHSTSAAAAAAAGQVAMKEKPQLRER